jgi:hypothetical protein
MYFLKFSEFSRLLCEKGIKILYKTQMSFRSYFSLQCNATVKLFERHKIVVADVWNVQFDEKVRQLPDRKFDNYVIFWFVTQLVPRTVSRLPFSSGLLGIKELVLITDLGLEKILIGSTIDDRRIAVNKKKLSNFSAMKNRVAS